MEYFVIAPDGSKFGPASLETLNKWAAQGRVTPTTIIERASDGVRGAAALLPGLVLPASATPPPPPPGGTPATPQPPADQAQPRTAQFKEATPTPPAVGATPVAPPSGGAATPGPSGPAQATPQTPGVPPMRGGVQFKEVEIPSSAAERQVPLGHGMSAVPPGASSITGYQRGQAHSFEHVPIELTGKFNWGAFFWTWIWGLNHRAFITLLSLGIGVVGGLVYVFAVGATLAAGTSSSMATGAVVGLVAMGLVGILSIALPIWYGARGYEWAWKSGRFETPDQCRRCQAIWGWWGLGILLVSCLFNLVLFGAVFMAAISGARGATPH